MNKSTTDTPRTDACPRCGARIYGLLGLDDETTYWQCDSDLKSDGSVVRSDLCREREKSQKLQAEVEALAQTIHSRTDPYPEWAICDSVTGIISQINNMVGVLLERAERAEAEGKEIRNALGDDGRRTHKELLEMAFKASGWKVWKEKYINLKNAHIAEGQDPAGTIWEHADKLQKELKASQAEVERLTKRPFGCKCETLRY